MWSLGDLDTGEGELVQRFFDGIEKYSPDLVSWNGSGFDLPVLTYRGLLHGVQAARYWETGDTDTSFRYNNYLSRYHWRHTDLMDVLCGFGRRGTSLANMAMLLGLPGKLGFDGSQVWETYLAGDLARIRAYCETDVLNTWLIWLRFAQLRGRALPGGAPGGARAREGLPARGARAAPRESSCAPGSRALEPLCPPRERAGGRGDRHRRRPHPRGRGGRARRQDGLRRRRSAGGGRALPAHRPSPPAR